MKYFYITGTSRGLGKALATLLLKKGDAKVFGISRSCSLEHDNYRHIEADLSRPEEADAVDFSLPEDDAEEIFLINNAGTLGHVTHLGNQSHEDISKALQVNVSAPGILMNNFLKQWKERSVKKVIINISSGAGKKAIDGWSTYCSSKAALDMMSKVVAEEQQLENTPGFHIFSVAPGIVDTRMQEEIRSVDKKDFSNIETFKEYKKNEDLSDPQLVADKFFRNFIDRLPENEQTIQTIRDYV